jgi:hypothetical protein
MSQIMKKVCIGRHKIPLVTIPTPRLNNVNPNTGIKQKKKTTETNINDNTKPCIEDRTYHLTMSLKFNIFSSLYILLYCEAS